MAIKNKEKLLPTRIVRSLCANVYGRPISDEAWSNWKKWADCSGRRHWLSADSALTLLAIAHLRHQNRFLELTRSQINQAEIQVSDRWAQLLHDLDQGLVLGKDADEYLSSFFLVQKPSIKSKLYRIIPGFSTKNLYQKSLLLQAIA